MPSFYPGQRWISDAEPELGLGTVLNADPSHVTIVFAASNETRRYSTDNPPLRRAHFKTGSTITTRSGKSFLVSSLQESQHLITYLADNHTIPESELADSLAQHDAEDRLLSATFDPLESYHLRTQARRYHHHQRRSPVRGFIGPRIDLIPHQLYIAHTISTRHAPRVLLSDEVGLGKTIEACLILHRLLLSGRTSRALILVPEPLVNQWFVEMLRRFNLHPAIFDEERCQSIEQRHPDANPFLDDQLILCSVQFLSQDPKRSQQAIHAGWDLVIVDEAHHLQWSPQQASPDYQLVDALAQHTNGLLLLTATPEQLGPESHFARLRLLDPDRYNNLNDFTNESADYRPLAAIIQNLQQAKKPNPKQLAALQKSFPTQSHHLTELIQNAQSSSTENRQLIVDQLLDLHGPGRVVLRNTRSTMQGFPQRQAHITTLPATTTPNDIEQLSIEFAVDAGDSNLAFTPKPNTDPRLPWLLQLIQKLKEEKILLICTSLKKVIALESALQQHLAHPCAVFHENLTLLQRDRNAAWFADPEGPQILLCSEIGSEGRNFQFAHHLVLFDLPLNPEILEQRIGRLDRIGQSQTIHIHLACVPGSPQAVLAEWYHKGLNALESHLEGGNELFRQFGSAVHDLAMESPDLPPNEAATKTARLIRETQIARKNLQSKLEEGRDRLLELNSFRPHTAQRLIEDIRREDRHDLLEPFMLDVFEAFGVHAEELAPHTYKLDPRGVTTEAFPSLPDHGLIATFDRPRALSREDVTFLSWDHPMVTGSIDLLLGSPKGNCTFGTWPDPNEKSILLEAWFVVEPVADRKLHADRFLPPTPIRVVINHKGQDVTDQYPKAALDQHLQPAPPYKLLDDPKIRSTILPSMITSATTAAEKHASLTVSHASKSMHHLLTTEINRLNSLQETHGNIHPKEITTAQDHLQHLTSALQTARTRLDSLRLIWKGPPQLLA